MYPTTPIPGLTKDQIINDLIAMIGCLVDDLHALNHDGHHDDCQICEDVQSAKRRQDEYDQRTRKEHQPVTHVCRDGVTVVYGSREDCAVCRVPTYWKGNQ